MSPSDINNILFCPPPITIIDPDPPTASIKKLLTHTAMGILKEMEGGLRGGFFKLYSLAQT